MFLLHNYVRIHNGSNNLLLIFFIIATSVTEERISWFAEGNPDKETKSRRGNVRNNLVNFRHHKYAFKKQVSKYRQPQKEGNI